MRLSKPSISFFCPAYKEEINLPIVVKRAFQTLKRFTSKFEIVIVEDGSPDKTAEIADSLAKKFSPHVRVIHHKRNLGYGPALRTGFKKADKYDYVFYTDSDAQFDVSELEGFIPHLASYDVVIGYRRNRALSPKRLVQTIIYNFLVRFLFGIRVKDINCAMKLVKRSILAKIELTSESVFIDAELLVKLHNLGIKFKEVGVTHYPRVAGKAYGGKLSVIWQTFLEMIAYWWELTKRKFKPSFSLIIFGLFSLFAALNIFYTPYAFWAEAISENWFIENGLVMYKDFVHHHTPLLRFILYGLSKVFGNTPHTLRLFSFISTLALAFFVYLSSKRISEKTALVSMLIFGIFFFPLFNNFHLEEMAQAFFLTASLYFAFIYLEGRKSFSLFISGILIASGVMVKQTVVFATIPPMIGPLLLFIRKNINLRDFIKSIFAFSLGNLIIFLPILLYFYSKDAIGDFFYYNVIFNLTIYRESTTAYALNEGLRVAWPLLLLLIPLTLFLLQSGRKKRLFSQVLLLLLFIVSLAPALFPSFLSVRLLPLFGMAALGWALAVTFRSSLKNRFLVTLVSLSFLIFLSGESKFLKSYYFNHFSRNFGDSSLSYDFGESEIEVARWLRENTGSGEKIMNMGNHFIYFLAGRLPANKYVYLLPWLVMPYEDSTNDILRDPPKIVIRDLKAEKDWPDLANWPFLKFLDANYNVRMVSGDLKIYVKQN